MTRKQGLTDRGHDIEPKDAALSNKPRKFGRVILVSALLTVIHGLMSCELPQFQSDDGSRFGFPNVERVAARASEVLPDPFRGKTNARRLREKMFGTHAVSSSRDINAEGLHD
ncbi:MAG: hypothetical protein GY801_33265 [bacterium]|nr:hypothetical protein [bacterium]